jgi:hypothetical protein
MADVVGIENVKPSRRVELMPYVASDAEYSTGVDVLNPFEDGQQYSTRAGMDWRMGVGPNLTLEGTINPDFGQVEADPAEVNLSAFETFFDERRPFFTEGSNLMEGGGAGYFYSRRIGAQPHYSPDEDEYDYVSSPNNTSILGAAKLTGRLNSGLNVGVLGAVTEREKADVFNLGDPALGDVEVEPLTGFGVVRLQQEFGKDASTAGIILTGVERDLEGGSTLDELLRRRAFAGGTDWNLRFAGGKYQLGGNVGASYIEGSRATIADAQTSSARFFQRPDADYVNFDPNRTSLQGWTSDLWFEKISGKHWLFGGGVGAESPEFEINDAGRLGSADDIDQWAWLRYRENEPGKLFQDWWMYAGTYNGWNFGGVRQYTGLDLEARATFKNFWGTWMQFEYWPETLNDNLTRGGPLMGRAANWNVAADLWSSGKGKTTWSSWGGYWENTQDAWEYWLGGRVTFRPGSRWELSLSPRWSHSVNSRQYIDTQSGNNPLTYNERYIFSYIERSQLRTQLRLNFAFTPDMTLEMYAEPFAASGRYYDFGELSAARSAELRTYGDAPGTSIDEVEDGVYKVTDGQDSFTFEQSNFNVLSFRSNLVLRWEWKPGSTLFFVWQTNRADDTSEGSVVKPRSMLDSLEAEGANFFAIKLTYWIPLL